MMNNKDIFHVHTYRCGHAADVPDEQYILRALELGADSITFTDHAPFPGDPFNNRMKYDELPDYINELSHLKEKYENRIKIYIGLEIEYLPSFNDYYKQLKECDFLDLLILGQHHYEVEKGIYSFNLMHDEYEYVGLINALVAGINTQYFNAVAHPDRAFRKCKEWTEEMKDYSLKLINKAKEYNVSLEKNLSSYFSSNHYWNEFWQMTDNIDVIYGCDAHNPNELQLTEYISACLSFQRKARR